MAGQKSWLIHGAAASEDNASYIPAGGHLCYYMGGRSLRRKTEISDERERWCEEERKGESVLRTEFEPMDPGMT